MSAVIAIVEDERAIAENYRDALRRSGYTVQLFETRAVAASELERLEAQRDADQAAVEAAEARLEDTVIRAPFAGRLGLRRISVGSVVTPSTVIPVRTGASIIRA